MATTTCSFTLNSSDLISTAPLSVATSNVLYKAGLQIGLDQVRMGRNEIPYGTNFNLSWNSFNTNFFHKFSINVCIWSVKC